MLNVLIRALLLYIVVVIIMRVMGKRQVGQLQPFELVIAIMLAELAAVPMQDKAIPLVDGLVPIATLLLAEVTIAYLSMRSQRVREIVCGVPSVLVESGRIVESEMRRNRYNLNDLMEQLRNKNVFNMADVEFAILETNGQLSVIPKSQKRPVCCSDLSISTSYEGLPTNLIVDGDVNHNGLAENNLDEEWLESELQKFGITSTRQVLFASLDTEGKLFYQLKEAIQTDQDEKRTADLG